MNEKTFSGFPDEPWGFQPESGQQEEQLRSPHLRFPHFQNQRIETFGLEFAGNQYHTLAVELGDVKISLDAHGVLALLTWLDGYRAEITALSEQFDAATHYSQGSAS